MKIWIDADACLVVIKEILHKAATRCQVPLFLVANQQVLPRQKKSTLWLKTVRAYKDVFTARLQPEGTLPYELLSNCTGITANQLYAS